MTSPTTTCTRRYHAVIYAVGAQTDRRMGIPGEDLPGSWAATEFVAWYNGHPDFRDRVFDLSCKRAVVVGNGNVAMDVARMLALTRDELAQTDVADHALDVLAESDIEEIVVLGRRGPAQAAFTNPELLELGEMTDADVFVDARDVEVDPLSRAWLESEAASTTSRKNVEILTGYAAREPEGKRRRIVLRFLVSPVEILGEERVEGIRICRNELAATQEGGLRACATETTEDARVRHRVPLDRLSRRRRWRACPSTSGSGTIPQRARAASSTRTASTLAGEYVVGWIKRGPTGIIGTNKRDAQETVDVLLEDLDAGRLNEPADPSRDSLEELLAERKPEHVTLLRLGGDRPRREGGRRAARPPAREAHDGRGAARGRARARRR